MVSLLCSEIGRGHPFYLDGLERALRAAGRADLAARRASVFEVSRGSARLAWRGVRTTYRLAGRGGLSGRVYRRLRGRVDYNRDTRLLRLLGRDARRWARDASVVVVDHPALVGALRGRGRVWYLHGELVAPAEALVQAAERIFVPLDETAAAFVAGGFSREKLVVTGICIENELLADAEVQAGARLQRLRDAAPLTLGFFSSGAEPRTHVRCLAVAAVAAARAGCRSLAFCAAGGRLEGAVRESAGGVGVEVVRCHGRADLDRRTAERFGELDVVVSPPHERSNWALALGIPFLLVGPDIGPFAPLNRELLLRRGVAAEISSVAEAEGLPARLEGLRATGELVRMAERGWGPDRGGFRRAAQAVIAEAGEA